MRRGTLSIKYFLGGDIRILNMLYSSDAKSVLTTYENFLRLSLVANTLRCSTRFGIAA